MEMQKTYNPKDFEDRIYADWEQSGYFRAEIDANKVPFTIMMPPPNITGQLHMGTRWTLRCKTPSFVLRECRAILRFGCLVATTRRLLRK